MPVASQVQTRSRPTESQVQALITGIEVRARQVSGVNREHIEFGQNVLTVFQNNIAVSAREHEQSRKLVKALVGRHVWDLTEGQRILFRSTLKEAYKTVSTSLKTRSGSQWFWSFFGKDDLKYQLMERQRNDFKEMIKGTFFSLKVKNQHFDSFNIKEVKPLIQHLDVDKVVGSIYGQMNGYELKDCLREIATLEDHLRILNSMSDSISDKIAALAVRKTALKSARNDLADTLATPTLSKNLRNLYIAGKKQIETDLKATKSEIAALKPLLETILPMKGNVERLLERLNTRKGQEERLAALKDHLQAKRLVQRNNARYHGVHEAFEKDCSEIEREMAQICAEMEPSDDQEPNARYAQNLSSLRTFGQRY